MGKKLRNSALAGTLGLVGVLGGCKEDPDAGRYFKNAMTLNNGHYVRAIWNRSGRTMTISEREGYNVLEDPYILAKDEFAIDRFDVVKLENVPEGHIFEQYVDLERLDKLFWQVSENGRSITD